MSATIYDVAKAAGVSITTVSRVLNAKGSVSPQTQRRVLKAIRTLHYHPNVNASGLAVSKTGIIGARIFGFDDVSIPDTFALEYLSGIQEVLYEKDYNLLIISDRKVSSGKCRPDVLNLINSKRMDGLIVYSKQVFEDPFPDMLKTGFPIVASGEYSERLEDFPCSSVCFDYSEYCHAALEGLSSRGHRQIGIITYAEGETELQERIECYHRVFEALGLPFERQGVINAADDKDHVWLRISELIQAKALTALYATNAYLAQQALDGIRRLGLRIPEDISLVCLEHAKTEGDWMNPSVSGVYVNSYEIGCTCARMLFDLMDGNPPSGHTKFHHAHLIDRGSIKQL